MVIKIHLRSEQECNNLLAEVRKLLDKEVISKSKPEFGGYIFRLLTRDKNDNTKCLILNMKNLNQSVKYKHFNMESIQNLLNMIEPEVFITSIDLKYAFFSVPIYEENVKILKLFVKDYCKFVYMSNGYGPAMCIFTKITKTQFIY